MVINTARRDIFERQLPESRTDYPHRRAQLQPGPIYRRARQLYWEFAHTTP
jgi:hypothetical protein